MIFPDVFLVLFNRGGGSGGGGGSGNSDGE